MFILNRCFTLRRIFYRNDASATDQSTGRQIDQLTIGIIAVSYAMFHLKSSTPFARDGSIRSYLVRDNVDDKRYQTVDDVVDGILVHGLDKDALKLDGQGARQILTQSPLLSSSMISCPQTHAQQLRNLDCRRRLPQVIVIGAKKSGTEALMFYLSSHPVIQPRLKRKEMHYWDWYPELGINWYLRNMPISSQYQVTVEKSASYLVGEDVPSGIARDVSPKTKLLLIIRDPVKRAISDYTHVITRYSHLLLSQANATNSRGTPRYSRANITYTVNKGFEGSVLNADGSINTQSAFIFTGMYSTHLRNWLKVFPLNQLLIIDGETFARNPLPQLIAIENFIELPKYYDNSTLYFDEDKNFYCLAKPKMMCLGKSKGRKHPQVSESVLQKLYEFYRPHNKDLEMLLNRKFSWIGT